MKRTVEFIETKILTCLLVTVRDSVPAWAQEQAEV